MRIWKKWNREGPHCICWKIIESTRTAEFDLGALEAVQLICCLCELDEWFYQTEAPAVGSPQRYDFEALRRTSDTFIQAILHHHTFHYNEITSMCISLVWHIRRQHRTCFPVSLISSLVRCCILVIFVHSSIHGPKKWNQATNWDCAQPTALFPAVRGPSKMSAFRKSRALRHHDLRMIQHCLVKVIEVGSWVLLHRRWFTLVTFHVIAQVSGN